MAPSTSKDTGNAALTGAERIETVSAPGLQPQADSDEALVKMVLSGKSEAFDQLVLRYQDRVFNILIKICSSAQEAEDLSQETFLKAYRALDSFRQGSKFYTWLFRIAVNAGLSGRRQGARRRNHEGGSLDVQKEEGEGDSRGSQVADHRSDCDPAHRLEKEALRARVREGLEEIDPDYRAILVLRDMEGLDYDQIADSLSITRAAVKSRLHRARLELARILKDLQ